MRHLIAFLALLGSCGANADAHAQRIATVDGWHTVVWTYDGDTIRLDDGTRIRLIGVNAPETTTTPWEPCAYEAKHQMFDYAANPVRIEVGESTTTDIYGRTLAYVFTQDGTLVNYALVHAGNAVTSFYPDQHNSKYDTRLSAAQTYAQAHPAESCLW